MPSVLVVHPDAGIRARVLEALVRHGLEAGAVTDLDGALDHPEVTSLRAVLADPVLLEQYELDFRTQIGVRAGADIALLALVDVADPARKRELKRHGAALLERPIDDAGALALQVQRLLTNEADAPAAAPPLALARLKVERVRMDDAALDAPVHPGDEGPMVLVVEDDEEARSFISSLLERRGYRVHSVSSASGALRFLGKEPQVRLIVSDIDMPVMDGFELKYALRESAIPFIAVAGDDSAERRKLATQLGMVALVAKPVQVKPFCELVRGTLLGAK